MPCYIKKNPGVPLLVYVIIVSRDDLFINQGLSTVAVLGTTFYFDKKALKPTFTLTYYS